MRAGYETKLLIPGDGNQSKILDLRDLANMGRYLLVTEHGFLPLALCGGIKETLIVTCQYFIETTSLVLDLGQHSFSFIKSLLF